MAGNEGQRIENPVSQATEDSTTDILLCLVAKSPFISSICTILMSTIPTGIWPRGSTEPDI